MGSNLLYGTYFGGTNFDSGNAIAVDSLGRVYLAGETSSGSGFPHTTPKPFQSNPGGGLDAFVAKFDPSGATELAATYLGGSATDTTAGIAVDTASQVYIAGNKVK